MPPYLRRPDKRCLSVPSHSPFLILAIMPFIFFSLLVFILLLGLLILFFCLPAELVLRALGLNNLCTPVNLDCSLQPGLLSSQRPQEAPSRPAARKQSKWTNLSPSDDVSLSINNVATDDTPFSDFTRSPLSSRSSLPGSVSHLHFRDSRNEQTQAELTASRYSSNRHGNDSEDFGSNGLRLAVDESSRLPDDNAAAGKDPGIRSSTTNGLAIGEVNLAHCHGDSSSTLSALGEGSSRHCHSDNSLVAENVEESCSKKRNLDLLFRSGVRARLVGRSQTEEAPSSQMMSPSGSAVQTALMALRQGKRRANHESSSKRVCISNNTWLSSITRTATTVATTNRTESSQLFTSADLGDDDDDFEFFRASQNT